MARSESRTHFKTAAQAGLGVEKPGFYGLPGRSAGALNGF